MSDGYVKPKFAYDATVKHFVAEMIFARRFILGAGADSVCLPFRGSMAGVSIDIPIVPGIGVTMRTSANGFIYKPEETSSLPHMTSAVYNLLAGGYYNLHFAKRLELQGKALFGYVWQDSRSMVAGSNTVSGWDVCAGLGLSLMLDCNFKVKVFSEYESMQRCGNAPWLSSVTMGFSTAWFW